MADHTKIEWTDATWNPITGCSVVSPGCTNCYAMRLAGGRLAHHPSRAGLTMPSKGGPVWTGAVRFNEEWIEQPLRWTNPRRIFVCAHGDLFHPEVPDEWIDRVFAVMALSPRHQFQVLTKRAKRMRHYMTNRDNSFRESLPGLRDAVKRSGRDPDALLVIPLPLPNVWLGVSAEDQTRWDERVEVLGRTPAAVHFVSIEPLLGPVDCTSAFLCGALHGSGYARIDWVIVGGESGPGARPMHPDWARAIRDQCLPCKVPLFFKQWGAWRPTGSQSLPAHKGVFHTFPDGTLMERVGKKAAGCVLDGAIWDQVPEAAA